MNNLKMLRILRPRIINKEIRSFSTSNSMSYPQFQDSEGLKILKNMFRQVMSTTSHQAIILTTLTDTTAQDARGMTLSSVTSLSIHPEPLVQFNMQIPSRTSEALHSRNLFALNFLTPTNGSIQKLRRFSQAINPKLRQSQVKIDEQDHDLYHDPFLSTNDFIYANGNFIKEESISDTNTEINWEKALSMEIPSSGSWIPTIANAAHVIYCDIYKTFTVNDHEIWVAKILAIEKRNEAKGGVLFHNHGFHGIGEKIDDLWPKSKAKIGSR